MKLLSNKTLNVTVAFLLFSLVFFDIFAVLPSLYGTSYYMFSLPYDSSQQMALWVSMLFVAIGRLLRERGIWKKTLRIVSDLVGMALLLFILFRIFHILKYIFTGYDVAINDDVSSVFAKTSIALITLAALGTLMFVSIILNIQRYKRS